jgi:hypothetical protein
VIHINTFFAVEAEVVMHLTCNEDLVGASPAGSFYMITRKERRHSGRETAELLIPAKIAREECIENIQYWDDWNDWRDGMRHNGDNTMLRSSNMCCAKSFDVDKYNVKIKKQIKIREARQNVRRM